MSDPASEPVTSGERTAAPRRRKGWKAFLTPGWVLTAVIVIAFAYVAFTVLAPWQLGKNRDTNEFNDRLEAGLNADPVPVSDVLPADGSSAGVEKEWTKVELQGRFLVDDEVLLRNRPVDGQQAYHALTPFRVDGVGGVGGVDGGGSGAGDGLTVLVNRGWSPPVEGTSTPDVPAATSTPVTLVGYVRMSEAQPGTDPMTSDDRLQVYGMSTPMVGEAVGLDLASDYVQLDSASVSEADPSGRMQALDLPNLDSGPYLSYGLQWIAFGVMVPLGLVYFIWAEVKERRRRRDEVQAAEGQVSAASTDAEPEPAAAPTPSRERKLEDRYGGSRTRFFEKRNARDEDRF